MVTSCRWISTTLVAVGLLGCSVPVARKPDSPATPSKTGASVSGPDPLHWVRDSSEYEASTRTIYRSAQRSVESFPNLCKAAPNTKPWIVIVDADETLLDNSLYQVESAARGVSYNEHDWNAWVGRSEEGIVPGAAEFVAAVARRCGHVVVVTNRKIKSEKSTLPIDECAVTTQRLHVLFSPAPGKPDPIAAVVCATADANGKTISDKNARFDAIKNAGVASIGSVDIRMFVGDSITDFPGMTACNSPTTLTQARGNFGTVWFQLPNPMYGTWTGCPARTAASTR